MNRSGLGFMTLSCDLAILRHLATLTHASAAEIGSACWMNAAEVRVRLIVLQSMRPVTTWRDPDVSSIAPRRIYVITSVGRRTAGVSDAKSKAAGPTSLFFI